VGVEVEDLDDERCAVVRRRSKSSLSLLPRSRCFLPLSVFSPIARRTVAAPLPPFPRLTTPPAMARELSAFGDSGSNIRISRLTREVGQGKQAGRQVARTTCREH
jgi:hypothetical protein